MSKHISLDYNGLSLYDHLIKEYLQNIIEDARDSVLEYPTLHDFPTLGKSNTIYIAVNQNASYRWDSDSLKYYCIGNDYNNIDVINGNF